jgi:outer membrane protein
LKVYEELDKRTLDPVLDKVTTPLIIQPDQLEERAAPDSAASPLDKEGPMQQRKSAAKKVWKKGEIPCFVGSLEEALACAYNFDVNLEKARTDVKLAVEEMSRSLSEWRPTIALKANQRMDTRRSSQLITAPIFPQIGANLPAKDKARSNEGNVALEATQNLYSGGGTIARIDKAQENYRASLCQLAAQEQSVFAKVVETYIDVIVAEESLTLAQKSEYYLTEILQQTKMRYEIGDDQTVADVEAAKAKLASATVQVISAQAQVKAKRADLVVLVKQPLSKTMEMPDFYKNLPKTLEDLNKCSLRSYPPIVAALHSVRVARFEVANVTSQFLPSVDLTGSVGTGQNWRQNRESPTFLRNAVKAYNRAANVYVSLTFPIYNKGITHSQYRSAEQNVKQAKLQLEQQRRSAIDMCATYFANFLASRDNVAATKVALESNKIALEAARTEFGIGLKKFLDMLLIEENWRQSYREHIRAMAELVKSSYNVLAMTGNLRATHLKLNVEIQDPCAYYDRYVDSLWSLGEDQEVLPLFAPCKSPEDKKF